MKFPFTVKHNGVYYEPGKDVPIGKEPVKALDAEDKTASELSKELKEKYGIDMAAQKGKAKLQEALAEAEAKAEEEAKALAEAEAAESEVIEGQVQLNLDGQETEETEESEEEQESEEDSEDESFLDKIINQE